MNTEPVRRPGASVIVAVLLSPLRAVERARGWRRLGLLMVYTIIALPLCAVLWRQSQLAGMPDVGESFNQPAASIHLGGTDELNAFVIYRRAGERFREMNNVEGDAFSKSEFHWSKADAVFRKWVGEQKQAISLLLAGSERPEAFFEQPGQFGSPLARVENNLLITRLSWIGTAALFEADRLRTQGDVAGAWALLKAVIRTSRNMERAAPIYWSRGTAMTLAQYAREPVSQWAKDPAVNVALLRKALDDVAAAEALTPPMSAFYGGEYQLALESLANLQPLIAERARGRAAAGLSDPLAFAPKLDAYLRGEPERSLRVLRLLAANDLAWCDRLATERPPLAVPRLRIYQADPAAPPESRALPPEDLARWADSILVNPALPWRMGDLERLERDDRWSMGQLKESVAVSLFTRERGRPPASSAEALKRYLPTPGDAPDRDESEPVPARAGESPPS
jgi:hypothetical protein